ncbi:hypothetical protein RCL1_005331 [Eukaryota sp. TZLM3-RCL]
MNIQDGLTWFSNYISSLFQLDFRDISLLLTYTKIGRHIGDFLSDDGPPILIFSIEDSPSSNHVLVPATDESTSEIAEISLPFTISVVVNPIHFPESVICFLRLSPILSSSSLSSCIQPIPLLGVSSISSLQTLLSDIFLQLLPSDPLISKLSNDNLITDLFNTFFSLLNRLSSSISHKRTLITLIKPEIGPSSTLSHKGSTISLQEIQTTLDIAENALRSWIDAINSVIKDPEIFYDRGLYSFTERDPGPLGEVVYWKIRNSKLQQVFDQLKEREFKSVISSLISSKSRLIKEWKQLEMSFNDAFTESKEVSRLLNSLEKAILPFYVNPSSSTVLPTDQFSSILTIIRALFFQTKPFGDLSKITNLMMRITRQLCECCKSFMGQYSLVYVSSNVPESVQNPGVFLALSRDQLEKFGGNILPNTFIGKLFKIPRLTLLHNCKLPTLFLKDFKKSLDFSKTKVESGASASNLRVLLLPDDQILDPIVSLCRKAEKFSNVLSTVHALEQLWAVDSSWIRPCQSFIDWLTNHFLSRDYDPFGSLPLFEQHDYISFKSELEILDQILSDELTLRFYSAENLHQKIQIVSSFSVISSVNLCKEALDAVIKSIVDIYSNLVLNVEEEFEANKGNLTHLRDVPSLTSTLIWSRRLQKQIEIPIRDLQKIQNLFDSRTFSSLVRKYNRVARLLVVFEAAHEVSWQKSIDNSKNILSTDILKVLNEVKLDVNFNNELRTVLRDARCLSAFNLGQNCETFTLRSEKIKITRDLLVEMIGKRDDVLMKIPSFYVYLITPLLLKLDSLTNPGIGTLNWISLGNESFIQRINTVINLIEECNNFVLEIVTENSKSIFGELSDCFPFSLKFLRHVSGQNATYSHVSSQISDLLTSFSDRFRLLEDQILLIASDIFEFTKTKFSELNFDVSVDNSQEKSFINGLRTEIFENLIDVLVANVFAFSSNLSNYSFVSLSLELEEGAPVCNFVNNSVNHFLNHFSRFFDLIPKSSEYLTVQSQTARDALNQVFLEWKFRADDAVTRVVENLNEFSSWFSFLDSEINQAFKLSRDNFDLRVEVDRQISSFDEAKLRAIKQSESTINNITIEYKAIISIIESNISASYQGYINSLFAFCHDLLQSINQFDCLDFDLSRDADLMTLCDKLKLIRKFNDFEYIIIKDLNAVSSVSPLLSNHSGISNLLNSLEKCSSKLVQLQNLCSKISNVSSNLVSKYLKQCEQEVAEITQNLTQKFVLINLNDLTISKNSSSPLFENLSIKDSLEIIKTIKSELENLHDRFNSIAQTVALLANQSSRVILGDAIFDLFDVIDCNTVEILSSFSAALTLESLRSKLIVSITDTSRLAVLNDCLKELTVSFEIFNNSKVSKFPHYQSFLTHFLTFKDALLNLSKFLNFDPLPSYLTLLLQSLEISEAPDSCTLMLIIDILVFSPAKNKIILSLINSVAVFIQINQLIQKTNSELNLNQISIIEGKILTVDIDHCISLKNSIFEKQSKLSELLRNSVVFPKFYTTSIRIETIAFIEHLSLIQEFLLTLISLQKRILPVLNYSLLKNEIFTFSWNIFVLDIGKSTLFKLDNISMPLKLLEFL